MRPGADFCWANHCELLLVCVCQASAWQHEKHAFADLATARASEVNSTLPRNQKQKLGNWPAVVTTSRRERWVGF